MYRVYRIPCFSFASAKTRSIVRVKKEKCRARPFEKCLNSDEKITEKVKNYEMHEEKINTEYPLSDLKL